MVIRDVQNRCVEFQPHPNSYQVSFTKAKQLGDLNHMVGF
jgi:hypothetical protein